MIDDRKPEVGDRVQIECLGRRAQGVVTEGDMGLKPASYRVNVDGEGEYYFNRQHLTVIPEKKQQGSGK